MVLCTIVQPQTGPQLVTSLLATACLRCSPHCSSILPIPFAISKTGVLVGVLTMLLVAWANDATSCMLIRAAAATGKPTYEALAEWAGGRPWKVSGGADGAWLVGFISTQRQVIRRQQSSYSHLRSLAVSFAACAAASLLAGPCRMVQCSAMLAGHSSHRNKEGPC